MTRRILPAVVAVALAGLLVQCRPSASPDPVDESSPPAAIPAPAPTPVERSLVSDPQPDIGLIARLGDNRLRHCGNVLRTAFHPNGRWVAATAFGENGARLWDVRTGEQVRRFADPDLDPLPIASSDCTVLRFTPTGRLVVGTHDGRVVAFDADTGKVTARFKAYGFTYWDLGVSADGKLAAGFADERELAVWDLDTGERVFKGPKCQGKKVYWSPDGSACFSPDGKRVAVCKTHEVVWYAPLDDPAAGREVTVLSAPGGKDGMLDLKWTANDRLTAWAEDGVRVIDTTSAKVLSHDPAGKRPEWPGYLANAAGTRGVKADSHAVQVFDLTSGGYLDPALPDIDRQPINPSWLSPSADGSRLLTRHGLWDLTGLRPKLLGPPPDTTAATEPPQPIPRLWPDSAVDLSADGTRMVTGGHDGFAVRRADPRAEWVVLEKYPERSLINYGPPPCPSAFTFHSDGRLFALRDNRLLVWDADPEPFAKPRSRPLDRDHPATALCFSSDGRRLALVTVPREVTRGQVRVLETATLGEVFRHAPDGGVSAATFDAKGRLVVAHRDCTTSIWDAERLEVNAVRGGDPERWADPHAKAGVGGVRALAVDPERAVRELSKLAEMTDAKRVAGLIAGLGDRDFAAREKATRALAALGADAEAALREAVNSEIPEVSDRATRLLEKLTPADGRRTAAQVRSTRAVEVLERANAKGAKDLLTAWGEQNADPFLRAEAKAAVARFAAR